MSPLAPKDALRASLLRDALAEDAEDLAAFEARKREPVVSFEAFLKELRRHGKL